MKTIATLAIAVALLPGLCAAAETQSAPRSVAAGEPLGWRVGPTAWSFRLFTFFEAVDKTASLGMKYLEAFQGQRVSQESDRKT